ncbi:16S rRNA (cytosine(1402)-N(4))-methyltransferase RsmH [Candidatus Williamhamiltonella defendens]|uniref:16S rRNA (cytosine(1402)-N(4))-methyltransferase RsmH n=1 Tax=Candidatus Williamhamiltonella defendens TaxID=138072 RepID=UPI00130D5F9E|nr:16S rRNA (cytosine(1402)-N(4))-methyltransferase RsmH [Candidatus Hamiltonella defensa]
MIDNQHKTVLLYEAVDSLNIQNDGIYIDATFGRGGHSSLILSRLGSQGKLISIDRDPEAFKKAKLMKDPRFSFIQGSFSNLSHYVQKLNLMNRINGLLFDLGVSSPQLDDAKRGFSFMRDGPLDMRMDPSCGLSAAEWLMKVNVENLAWVLKNFGEERFSTRLARAIVERNQLNPIKNTKELADLISHVIPIRNHHKHPATRSFQAIRIYINDELQEISSALDASLEILSLGGRLSVVSFHSLEDRIVKNFIRQNSRGPQILRGLPLTEIQIQSMWQPKLKLIGKTMPSQKDVLDNPRSRSSILRFAERIN